MNLLKAPGKSDQPPHLTFALLAAMALLASGCAQTPASPQKIATDKPSLDAAHAAAADNRSERERRLEAQFKEMAAIKTPHGMVITLGDVLFDSDKATLRSSSVHQLDKLVAFLQRYPQRRVLAEGFTDSSGTSIHNQELAGQRAEAVRTLLVSQGIDSERVTTRAYAEESPVASNQDTAGRRLNRRVELVLSDARGNMIPR